MKHIVVERPVKDIDGLLMALKKTMANSVISVASDPKKTYVYLKNESQENPSEQVMAWQDPPELMVSLEGDIPIADGKAKASVIISHAEPFTKEVQPGNFKVQVDSKNGLKLSFRKLSLKTGRALLEVGPATDPLVDTIYITDPYKRLSPISIDVPFAEVPPSPEKDGAEITPPKRSKVWNVFRRLRKKS